MLGSPFTARLCDLAADRLAADASPVARRLLTWTGDPTASGDAVALRLCGALHALVLAGREPVLSDAWPPRDGDIGDDALWRAVETAMGRHTDEILERLDLPPQTNEVRRAAALAAGLLAVRARRPLPVVLSEVGASAGLNLNLDRFRHDLGGVVAGDPASPVRLAPDWQGPPPPAGPIEIRDRAGCDRRPVDISRPEDRLRLLSYVWPDQPDRLERTRAALEIARDHPPAVAAADAVEWLADRLATRHPGAVHVIAHTIMWQYLTPDARAAGDALIARAGAAADDAAPLARLAMEQDGDRNGAGVTLQIWPGGERYELGRVDFHGRWMAWRGLPTPCAA